MFYLSQARQLDAAHIDSVELPAGQDLRELIRFVIAVLTERGRPFVRFPLSQHARQALLATGFL